MQTLPGTNQLATLTGTEMVAVDTGGADIASAATATFGAVPQPVITGAGVQAQAQYWTLSTRNALTTFPVVVMRPTTVNTGLAFDLMPNGAPGNNGNAPFSVCWFDVCNADTLVGATKVATARVGCGTSLSEFGSYAFSGATLNPLALTMGGKIAMNLANTGYQWDFSVNFPFNGRSYLTLTNSSAGASAYTEIAVQNNVGNGLISLRAYGGGWTAVAADQNYGELTTGAGLAGLNITTNTGAIRILTGGFTPGGPGTGDQAGQVNSVGGAAAGAGALVWYYPIHQTDYVYATPLTGATVVITDTQSSAIIEPSGTIAALTVQLPTAAAAYDGKVVEFSSTQIVTTLTVTATAGTVVNAPAALAVGQGVRYKCIGSSAKWYLF